MEPLNTSMVVSAEEPSHDETAAAHLEQLRAMRQTIPNFMIPADTKDTQRRSTAASVSPEFVQLSAVVVKKAEALGIGGPNAAWMRDRLAFADAYGPVADEFDAMAQFLRHSIVAAQSDAGSAALLVYENAKRLAKRSQTSELAPYVADLSRALGQRAKIARAKAAKRKAAAEKAHSEETTAGAAPAPSVTTEPA